MTPATLSCWPLVGRQAYRLPSGPQSWRFLLSSSPWLPANFSAWGLLNTDFREDRARTLVGDLADLTPEVMGDHFYHLRGCQCRNLG